MSRDKIQNQEWGGEGQESAQGQESQTRQEGVEREKAFKALWMPSAIWEKKLMRGIVWTQTSLPLPGHPLLQFLPIQLLHLSLGPQNVSSFKFPSPDCDEDRDILLEQKVLKEVGSFTRIGNIFQKWTGIHTQKKGLGTAVGINRRDSDDSRSLRTQPLIAMRDQSHQLINLLWKRNNWQFW